MFGRLSYYGNCKFEIPASAAVFPKELHKGARISGVAAELNRFLGAEVVGRLTICTVIVGGKECQAKVREHTYSSGVVSGRQLELFHDRALFVDEVGIFSRDTMRLFVLPHNAPF